MIKSRKFVDDRGQILQANGVEGIRVQNQVGIQRLHRRHDPLEPPAEAAPLAAHLDHDWCDPLLLAAINEPGVARRDLCGEREDGRGHLSPMSLLNQAR